MSYTNSIPEKKDRWDRRSGIDRRCDFTFGYVPERRFNQERRCVQDRRTKKEHVILLRRMSDNYMEFVNTIKGISLASLLSLLFWGLIIFLMFTKR